jgi:hypothetical protein
MVKVPRTFDSAPDPIHLHLLLEHRTGQETRSSLRKRIRPLMWRIGWGFDGFVHACPRYGSALGFFRCVQSPEMRIKRSHCEGNGLSP